MKHDEERMRTVEMLCDQFAEILEGQAEFNDNVGTKLYVLENDADRANHRHAMQCREEAHRDAVAEGVQAELRGLHQAAECRHTDIADLQARAFRAECELENVHVFADRVTDLLIEQCTTNNELAAYLGIERVAVWQWDNAAGEFVTAYVLKGVPLAA